MYTKPVIVRAPEMSPGDNAVIEIHPNLNGGATINIKDAKHPQGYPVRINPNAAIGMAFALLEAAGIPIQAALAQRAAAKAGGKTS